MDFPPLDFTKIRTIPLQRRAHKVQASALAKPWVKGGSLARFLDSIPHILVAEDFRRVVEATVTAVRNQGAELTRRGSRCSLLVS